MIQRQFKDRLFRMIFSSKTNLLLLYNAINGSDYTDESEFEVTTIADAVYMGMKNDVSFLLDDTFMNFYEHQSTLNPNMPVRGFIYGGIVYSNYIEMHNLDIYSKTAVKLPIPKYIVFYNGSSDAPDICELKLSDLFINSDQAKKNGPDDSPSSPDYEWTATMININYGHNMELMEKCRPLMEYSIFTAKVREHLQNMPLKDAVDSAVTECIADNVLADFLRKNRTEVTDVFLTEYDEEKVMNGFFKDGVAKGLAEGLAKGKTESREDGIKILIGTLKEFGIARNKAISQLAEKYDLTEGTAEEYMDKYWE